MRKRDTQKKWEALNPSEILYHSLKYILPSDLLSEIFQRHYDHHGRLSSRCFTELLEDLKKKGIVVY